MKIDIKVKEFLTELQNRTGMHIQLQAQTESDYVTDYLIMMGINVFRLHHNLKTNEYGWQQLQ